MSKIYRIIMCVNVAHQFGKFDNDLAHAIIEV